MHTPIRLPALITLTCLILAIGCKKEESPPQKPTPSSPTGTTPQGATRPSVANPATRPAPTSAPEVDVPAILRAGGKHWSSIPDGQSAPGLPTGGTDYWIWPADDTAYTPETGPNAKLTIKLNWRLRPGGQPAGETLYATVASTRPEAPFSLRNAAKTFDSRSNGGVIDIPFAPWKATATGEVTLFASKPGSAAPVSNVLRLHVTPPAVETR